MYLKARIVLRPSANISVSILVFLDYVFKAQSAKIILSFVCSFQSLFFWIMYLKLVLIRASLAVASVSILVFLDYVFKAIKEERHYLIYTIVSILVFLDYVFKELAGLMTGYEAKDCFNPCFSGLCI